MVIPEIRIEDFDYPLPETRIAKFPLQNRDDSKLLVNSDGNFKAESFKNIAEYLPKGALMVFNETKVVPARLFFRRETGAIIEIFALEPVLPADYATSFAATQTCRWKTIVGNVKRWKEATINLLTDENTPKAIVEMGLRATLINREDNSCIVDFSWSSGASFSQVLEMCGHIPIPPYLNRETEAIDYERYQTSYALQRGSVAAPTAGLHFTDRQMEQIDAKGIERANLCLHVGAGTFLPVKSELISDHHMHSEPFTVTLDFLERLQRHSMQTDVVAVGTTSTRTLESLYYLGVHTIENGEPGSVEQWEPYREKGYAYTAQESINSLINYLKKNNKTELTSRTSLIIVPGYEFRLVTYLVTNFHQPKSTLLLLISAFIGDGWRQMYRFALDNDFRFLSYGDSSLLKKKG
ncbi:MAG: S-adenosylmethionine:tRNA ribosyltransferase-isomerase [Bacteroidales bacterium]|nr:S-adenosylmethionine:tRNA ribosyltransferase-isomerase [Bacteroidales bacterium]